MARSASLVAVWGVEAPTDLDGSDRVLQACRKYVQQTLAARCTAARVSGLAGQRAQLKYTSFQTGVACMHAVAVSASLPWDVLIGMRGWSRLRISDLTLTHREGRRSAAKVQVCIFCSCQVRLSLIHCLGRCTRWASEREKSLAKADSVESWNESGIVAAVLGDQPVETQCFVAAVRWAARIDHEADAWWLTQTA